MLRVLFKTRKVRVFFGNILITLALFTLIYIYLPYFLSLFPTASSQLRTSNYNIEIPKIHALAPIIENVDPWNKKDYQKALKKGVAKAKGYNNFYFAHSSLPPWEMTRTNTAFLRLGQLNTGDEILTVKDGVKTKYTVTEKLEVWPGDIKVVQDQRSGIILQTCTPPGTSFKRLLVIAEPK